MAEQIEKYGIKFNKTNHPLAIEMYMIQKGGQWKTKTGRTVGEGLFYHYKAGMSIIWPEIVWHKWNNQYLQEYVRHRTIGVMGAASTGKTNTAATVNLFDYYCFPTKTSLIICSTTRERLEDRIWGEIKRFHKLAKERFPWLDGHVIEGRMRIVTNSREEALDGRDFRNGIIGVPCKRGENYVGLGDFAGIKNKRVRLLGDEIHLLPRVWVDAISNLDKNTDFKATGLGNPKDTTDSLGIFCEPASEIGGWESNIDQGPGTKHWKTRRPEGIAMQWPGSDSPNLDGKLGIPLITQEQIDRDVAFYGKDSINFTMMNEGKMPRGMGSKRVITRQMCVKFKALEEPNWLDNNQVLIAALDAAYRGVGGDRCVLMFLKFGLENLPPDPTKILTGIIDQSIPKPTSRRILALVDTFVIPITQQVMMRPEDQIVSAVAGECARRGIPPENFFYDSGMRTSLVEAFAQSWSTQTNSIDCGGTPTERKVSSNIDIMAKDYYSKLITELWWSVALIIEAGQFRGMTEDVMNEGCMREFGMVGGNKYEIEPKAKMKEKTGRSPDLFDALAIGCEGARRRGFHIMRADNLKYERRRDQSWKRELEQKSRELWSSSALNFDT